MNEVTSAGGNESGQRVTHASPEWAAGLRDAQARANARRNASADAAVTAWVRALMRDLRHRTEPGSSADRQGD
jgi:hypothetical protein